VVLAAVAAGSGAFKHASPSLRANKPFVWAAARDCDDPYGLVLAADPGLVADKYFMAEVGVTGDVYTRASLHVTIFDLYRHQWGGESLACISSLS
jgi:hypothetical protein